MDTAKRMAHYKANYRRFSFGRREGDNRPSVALMSIPKDAENMQEVAIHLVKLMPSSEEYFEGLMAQLQKDGYVVVLTEENIPCLKP